MRDFFVLVGRTISKLSNRSRLTVHFSIRLIAFPIRATAHVVFAVKSVLYGARIALSLVTHFDDKAQTLMKNNVVRKLDTYKFLWNHELYSIY